MRHGTARITTLAASALLGLAAPALAQGAGCADAVAGWRETAERENTGGFMGDSVYKQVQDEIGRADGLCQAGQDPQARRAVAESRRRHGY